MKLSRMAFPAVAVLIAVAGPARAHDHHHHHRPHTYEYRVGGCKYEYKAGRHGFKEEYKCKRAPHAHVVRPPIVVWEPAPIYQLPDEHYVYAVPTRDFTQPDGRYCREYQRTATIGGRPQQVYGTACLMPDGSWQIAD
ncbi:MAG TPA: hypothetical protein VF342_08190 [Alphaproteobacteria bacterium]